MGSVASSNSYIALALVTFTIFARVENGNSFKGCVMHGTTFQPMEVDEFFR